MIKLLFMTIFFNLHANEPTALYSDYNLKNSIQIIESEKIHMNQECKDNEVNCIGMIKQRISIMKKPAKKALKGNPASELCHSIGGSSKIYYDKEHNEYDYCKIKHYELSSWDIYYQLKK